LLIIDTTGVCLVNIIQLQQHRVSIDCLAKTQRTVEKDSCAFCRGNIPSTISDVIPMLWQLSVEL